MSNYNPLPTNVREAFDNFKSQAEAAGFSVSQVLIHSAANFLQEGEDVEVGDDNGYKSLARYWPKVVTPYGTLSVACTITEDAK